MNFYLDKLAADIQKEIWSQFSDVFMDHAKNPRNIGRIENADGYGCVTGLCGDTIQIWLKVTDGKIGDIAFWTDGCGTTIAAGSMVTELARGRTLPEALQITPRDVLDALGGLPEDSVHCAFLAANTLHEAIKDYQKSAKAGHGEDTNQKTDHKES
ncbi:iron-sulfur cluster assembly scaffold protein [Desulfofundulus thermobenzoicus]|uniref:Iron-sulfur cluster assembly scaffold protein n=1 Tax=Desulfofundulus thermobenzoicus TaxID=29376 RepID=A0A6N7IMP1_9FIRM|nr:iron-sulfur cluster assembly scaffold protein [Desulfofundulus thermobenzoicus]MQL50889.1 iron-sulfur cluster assembly scaffold protein [Desulfofundulus thermobenzoicus]